MIFHHSHNTNDTIAEKPAIRSLQRNASYLIIAATMFAKPSIQSLTGSQIENTPKTLSSLAMIAAIAMAIEGCIGAKRRCKRLACARGYGSCMQSLSYVPHPNMQSCSDAIAVTHTHNHAAIRSLSRMHSEPIAATAHTYAKTSDSIAAKSQPRHIFRPCHACKRCDRYLASIRSLPRFPKHVHSVFILTIYDA